MSEPTKSLGIKELSDLTGAAQRRQQALEFAGFLAREDDDTLYVADSDSDSLRNPGWKKGIRIGSAKDGSVKEFIPYPGPDPKPGVGGAAEGVAADAFGNVYGAEVAKRTLQKYVKK